MNHLSLIFFLSLTFTIACATNGGEKNRPAAASNADEQPSAYQQSSENQAKHPKGHYKKLEPNEGEATPPQPSQATYDLTEQQTTPAANKKTKTPNTAPKPTTTSSNKAVVQKNTSSTPKPGPDLSKLEPVKASDSSNPASKQVVTEAVAPPPAPTPMPPAVDHSTFDQLLSKYVDAKGQVNYMGLKGAQAKLEGYLQQLSQNAPQSSWSRATRLAYWINAYNAYTLKLILDHYPVQSIRDIDDGNPWDTKWIRIGGDTYSLNQIEHKIIRPRFEDPRIHFAVNCAAASCPPLADEAFTAKNVDQLLERRTREFINNPAYNNLQGGTIKVSKLFDWYQEDFGDVVNYINQYAKTNVSDKVEVDYKEYDWKLNGR